MRDRFLVFPNARSFERSGLTPLPGVIEIDEIGEVRREVTPATYAADGTQATPPIFETLPGWHVNIRVADDRSLEEWRRFVVEPATPVRAFATEAAWGDRSLRSAKLASERTGRR